MTVLIKDIQIITFQAGLFWPINWRYTRFQSRRRHPNIMISHKKRGLKYLIDYLRLRFTTKAKIPIATLLNTILEKETSAESERPSPQVLRQANPPSTGHQHPPAGSAARFSTFETH
jgi:hypothetical protein